MYPTCIIGGGLAGLTIAEALAKRGESVVVLEKYKSWGGRVVTYRTDSLQYEIGAGRIFRAHRRVHNLIRRFGLHTYPIRSDFSEFTDAFEPIRTLILESVPEATLRRHTIAAIIPPEFHPLLRKYPYWAELHLLRADIALRLFAADREMGASDFCGVVEGLDALTTGLATAAAAAGADLRNRHNVTDIKRREDDGMFEIQGLSGKKAEAKPFTIMASRVILTVLHPFSVIRDAPMFKQLRSSPLTRIYAVYPTPAWFADMPKMVVDGPLRFIIPIDASKGLIMISYTDGDDTLVWNGKDGDELMYEIQAAAKATFPYMDIPDPTFLKKHEWPQGCTYWLPGDYDVDAAIAAAQNPAPNVYVAGEIISRNQAWMESALESAENLLVQI